MPYYGDTLPYYYGGPFSNHSSLMTGTGRTLHSPLGSTRYAPHLTTISESPLSTLRRYSPAATMTARPKRIIDTADIDVSTPRALSSARSNNEPRNRLRRDRPTIRIRSQALKDNPALREHYERHEKTVGELLVEKFLIKDKKAKADDEVRTKLYSQVSLDDDLTKEQRDDLQEAIKRRITRRMTRRRSSADVQMDPEQIEREVLFAQAQADALDTLVAEEQAEIEVEARMGTLIRKNLVRSVAPSTRSSRDVQGTSGDDGDDARTKKLAKKVKKRKKTSDKPSPPSESDLDSERDATRTKKVPRERNEEGNDKVDKAIVGRDETAETLDGKANEENSNETSPSPTALKFKIEASNSVGDFSTLWINAGVAVEREEPRKHSQDATEQFRDSVRLPAPKRSVDKTAKSKKKDAMIEEHQQTVVIPVKKRYVKDEARNSVYLTLKTQTAPNAKKTADTRDKIDRMEAIDDTVHRSSSSSAMINGKITDAGRSMNVSSMADDATSGIKRQSRVNKVAKFRSKDITESDVDVESISAWTGATSGKIETKDASLQNSLGIDDDTSNAAVSESISETSNRDKNERSPSELTDDRSNDRNSSKLFIISEDAKTNLETTKTRDTGDNLIDTDSLVSESEASSTRDDKIPIEDGGTEKSRENGEGGKVGKPPVRRAKKYAKELQGKDIDSVGDESKRLERSVGSSPDSSNVSVCAENSQHRRNDEEEQLVDSETEPSPARTSSAFTPFSNLVESLPNASTINFPDVTKELTIGTKIQSEESTVERIEATRMIPEDPSMDENLSLQKTEKFRDTRSEIAKSVDVLDKKSEIDNLIEEEARKVVEQPATIESPNILTPTKNDASFVKNENEEKLAARPSKKLVDAQATIKDDKGIVELPKLCRNRKILPFSSRNDSAEAVKLSSPDSPVYQAASDAPGKNRTITKVSVAAANDDAISSPKIEELVKGNVKDTAEFVTVTKECEDSLDRRVESTQPTSEPSKLTNGVTDEKPKPIVEIKKLVTADSKTSSKLEISCGRKNDEIDFWGEIASEAKSCGKLDEKIARSKEIAGDNSSGHPTTRDGDSMVTVLEFETKSEASPESGTREKTESLVGADEKKSSKAKKKRKKPSENGGCKKKDQQEKVSAETIFERSKITDDADESHQRAERLEQRSVKLRETSVSGELGEEKICEDPAIDKLGRNLSTIVEESPGPISEEAPKSFGAFDIAASRSIEDQESSARKLNVTEDSSSLGGKSERIGEPSEKDISASVSTSLDKTEVPLSGSSPEPETPSSTDPVSPNSKTILPSINIILSPSTPDEEEIRPEVEAEEVLGEEAEEGPGTPTNETIDDSSKSIAKWHGLADLSLDEPDKDIGLEAVLGTLLKNGVKKKAGDSKKPSKKSTNSTRSIGGNQDSSKKKKLGKRKKSSIKNLKTDTEKKIGERSSSNVSNSSDATLKPNGQNLLYSPKNSGCGSPKQRPLDLIKMFYTTPASLLTATPRDLSKVRRAKIKKRKHSSRTASASSDSTGSTRSTQSTGTAESTASTEHEDDTGQKRISSTRSNDSGFDGSPRLSNCDMACHKKCEKLTGNLCGLNQKLVAEALQALKRAPSQSSDNQRNSDGSDHHASGRVTPPATNLPRFKKYTVTDFNFLKVLGKGSFGKVLLAELRRTDCVYAVKCLKKDVVLEDDDVECTLIERKVLTLATRHPYLCHLFCTFQTDSHLFFVMEYLNGGDLMFHIQKSGRFAESRARFYAAEIYSGLNFLHKKGIVYRDLKLDNVLLDFEGHIRIADFGMCKLQIFLDRTADTFCGTPDYMAPEIIKGLKYNQAVDWWSFGVLLYEMLTGQSPFSGCDEDELFWSICNERPFIPRYLSQEAMDVLVCLLEKDAGKRPPAHEISVHPFFHSLQWDRLERRQLEPPFKPALEHTLDTRYFDTAFTAERPRLTPVPEQILTSMDQGVFRGFSYTNPNATD